MQFEEKRIIHFKKMAKNLILGPDLGPTFFCKNLAFLVTRYHDLLSWCTIPKQNNDPILRKFSGRRTDEKTGKSDFIGRSPTNVKRAITSIKLILFLT